MEIRLCDDEKMFFKILVRYENCFFHLKERISSLSEYATKVFTYGKILFAIDNGDIIGFCAFYDNDIIAKTGYITLIGVKEECRKRSVGKKLLMRCEEIMRISGMRYIKLEVDDDNEVAKKFYIDNGYCFNESVSATSQYMVKQL